MFVDFFQPAQIVGDVHGGQYGDLVGGGGRFAAQIGHLGVHILGQVNNVLGFGLALEGVFVFVNGDGDGLFISHGLIALQVKLVSQGFNLLEVVFDLFKVLKRLIVLTAKVCQFLLGTALMDIFQFFCKGFVVFFELFVDIPEQKNAFQQAVDAGFQQVPLGPGLVLGAGE